MQLGWIDFSETDRKQALGVLTMMDEPGAVDEIGIGRIRDAFSNIFFPGTSTIMTRAKYYFIVPYAFKEALANTKLSNYRQVIMEVEDNIERDCAVRMLKKNPGSRNGIIGSRSLERGEWVARKPSSIYWNALRSVGIFTSERISTMESYIKISLANRENIIENKKKNDEDDGDQDDNDAFHRKMKPFWNLPEGGYSRNWKKDLSIALTYDEAAFLRKQISSQYQDTLFKAMVDNSLQIANDMYFEEFTQIINPFISQQNQQLLVLANKFNVLVYLIKLRYNYALTRGHNQDVIDRWNRLKNETDFIKNLNIKNMMQSVGVYDTGTRIFLEKSQDLLLENRIAELDQWVKQREISLKGQRSKLLKANDYNSHDLVADYWLDYRLKTARTIVNDILDAEKRYENNNIRPKA